MSAELGKGVYWYMVSLMINAETYHVAISRSHIQAPGTKIIVSG